MHPLNDQTPRASVTASLTYEPFYGLDEKAFSLSADPRFLYKGATHTAAFDALLSGIRRREGLIVLTGEIGTGKTTLCRSVLERLDLRTFSAFVADPFVSREDLLKALLVDFGVISRSDLTQGRYSGASRSDLSYPLYEFLDSLVAVQAFAVVVIDEAQNLSPALLEEIRILSELEQREKLLQVVLVGQPELRASLRLPQMRQVEQRVWIRCELQPLDATGVAEYVNHRLEVAGRGDNRAAFTKPALTAVYQGSSGVPRLINRICDRALEHAYASRSLKIDAPFVWRAIDDFGLQPPAHAQESVSVPAAALPPTPIATPAVGTQFIGDPRRTTALKTEHFETRRRWLAAAAAPWLVAAASVGIAAWYTGALTVGSQDLAPLLPARPTAMLSQPIQMLPPLERLPLQSLGRQAVPAASRPTSESAPPASPVPEPPKGFSIVVASFESQNRAEQLVDELTNAGYGAHAVELDRSRAHGRRVQVRVSGYTSALDVQRDLQRIHELPAYRDAYVVEHD